MTNQYSELQEFLNKCIEMGWKPRGDEFLQIKNLRVEGGKVIVGGLDRMTMFEFYSYHDLFSVDSGLMDFVEWKQTESYYVERVGYTFDDGHETCAPIKYLDNRVEHYMVMGPMTKEKKIKYFLENALLPTQD